MLMGSTVTSFRGTSQSPHLGIVSIRYSLCLVGAHNSSRCCCLINFRCPCEDGANPSRRYYVALGNFPG